MLIVFGLLIGIGVRPGSNLDGQAPLLSFRQLGQSPNWRHLFGHLWWRKWITS